MSQGRIAKVEATIPSNSSSLHNAARKIGLNSIPLSAWVILTLIIGFGLGTFFPKNKLVHIIAESGTYFPKTIVTFASPIIFFLLAGATAKLLMVHKDKAGKLFARMLMLYLAQALGALIWVSLMILLVMGLQMTVQGTKSPTFYTWAMSVLTTFKTIVSQQPLIQALFAAVIIGWFSAVKPRFHSVAYGIMKTGDIILKAFKWLLWYYPIMIGCLAILIPLKFGIKGIAYYGKSVMWTAIATISWAIILIIVTKLVTKRTWKQIFAYFWTVYPTGFGTGGSYDTLAVNVIATETQLGLKRQIAETSIVFGTVLNKCAATMAVMICTVTVSWMMKIPISFTEIMLLILPIWILGLESPGVPGGAGFFMSPVIAVILNVPDPAQFITTFVAMYSGLIPMLTTAVNTIGDGFIGAILQDRFLKIEERV